MCTCLSRALNFKSLTITNTISITLAHLAWFVSNFLTFSRSRSFSLPFLSFSFFLWFFLYSFPSSFQFSHFHFQYFSEFSLYPFDRTLTRCCSLLKCTVKIPIELRVEDNTKIEFSEQKNHLTSLALFFFYFAIIAVDSFFLFARECVFGAFVVSHAQADHNQLLYVLCVCVMNMRDRSTHKRPTNTSITHKQKLQALILVYVTVLRN